MPVKKKHQPGCPCCTVAGGVTCNDLNPFPTVDLELEFEYLDVTLTETSGGPPLFQYQHSASCVVTTLIVPLIYSFSGGLHTWQSASYSIRGHPAAEYRYPQNTLNPYTTSNCGWATNHKWIINCSATIGRNWVIHHQVGQAGTGNLISYRQYDLNNATFVADPLYAEFTTPLSTCPPNPPPNQPLNYCEGDRRHVVTLP